MHGVLDALVTAAAADVTRHRFAYLVMRGFWIVHQQRGRLHDLTGLAEAALRHIDLAPGLLNGMVAGRMQAFDGGDLPARGIGEGRDAGTDRLLVHDHGARSAQRLAAAELGSGHSDFVANKPQQWEVRIPVPAVLLAIDFQFDHDRSLALLKLFDVFPDTGQNIFPLARIRRSRPGSITAA